MSIFNTINAIDGNQYLINSADSVSNGSTNGISFDDIYNSQTGTKNLEDIFQSVSAEYGVPISLLKAVAQAESDFDTNAVSGCGASGIMQLMPETAAGLGVEDVFDAEQNITGGAKMLAYLLNDYNGNTTLALAAYNAGSGAVAKYGGVPPYEETRNYIAKINNILNGGLEADTSGISIEKNQSVAASASTTSLNLTSSVNSTTSNSALNSSSSRTTSANSGPITNPIKIVDEKDQASEVFSYENYLKFLEIYQDMMSAVFKSSSADSEDSVDSFQNYIQNSYDNSYKNSDQKSEQQNLYELQQAKFNSRALSIMDVL